MKSNSSTKLPGSAGPKNPGPGAASAPHVPSKPAGKSAVPYQGMPDSRPDNSDRNQSAS